MLEKKGREEGFCEDIGCHIGSGDPSRVERAFRNMITNEVISNINVF